MATAFEWLAQKFREFNSWFKLKWNRIISKLLFKQGL